MLSENIHSYYDYHGHFNFLPMSPLILTLIFVSNENIKKVKFAILKVLYLLLIRYQIEKTASWEIFLFIRIHSSFANIKNILNFKRELKISLWEMFGQILTMFGKYKPIYSLSYLKRKGISHLAPSQ